MPPWIEYIFRRAGAQYSSAKATSWLSTAFLAKLLDEREVYAFGRIREVSQIKQMSHVDSADPIIVILKFDLE